MSASGRPVTKTGRTPLRAAACTAVRTGEGTVPVESSKVPSRSIATSSTPLSAAVPSSTPAKRRLRARVVPEQACGHPHLGQPLADRYHLDAAVVGQSFRRLPGGQWQPQPASVEDRYPVRRRVVRAYPGQGVGGVEQVDRAEPVAA